MDVRLNLQRLAILATKGVARFYGEQFPFYYVMEFPKSGGSWLADMIADYLQIPRPVQPVFPIGFKAVLHGHWGYSPRYKRVAYLYRDGRDVCVSLYFRTLQEIKDPPYKSTRAYYRKRLPSLFDVKDGGTSQLPKFIEEWAVSPGNSRRNWAAHIDQWTNGRPGIVTVSYEQLLEDPSGALAPVLEALTGEEVNAERLAATVHKFSFEQQTGRKRGAEDRTSFIRKGIAGDWRNHFNREAGRVFDERFGETLVRLGYETDRDWWQSLPE